ncbi:dTDP-glucose 4,6-dehydratase [Candidatus Woesearchaeota archaeon CG10_big_fil_rev_8_21_14_0_10_37_12]|nr:MAG: dTDP-glucose 4,6-dehydratase [Candidatus Woesearchaeota archaeon CG10_big_fil_rev_8_21_14_0_10_37_12]
MKLLVTGGAGFIGTNFIKYMFANNPDIFIINVDKLTYASVANQNEFNDLSQYTFVKEDISKQKKIEFIFQQHQPDIVVNFAAETHVDRSIQNPEPFITSNIIGTFNILEAARKNNTYVHQVSTDEVYGSVEKEQFTEESPYNPRSPYSATKASADHLVRAYNITYGLPITISTCSNNYGPYQHPEKFIPTAIINALNNKPIPLYGDGQNVRDWLYVEDHCSAINLIIRKGKKGETYGISSESEKINKDVLRIILKELQKEESLINHVTDRKGHDRRYSFNSTKIREQLGWSPKTTFDQGIQKTIEWYKKNKHLWEKLTT